MEEEEIHAILKNMMETASWPKLSLEDSRELLATLLPPIARQREDILELIGDKSAERTLVDKASYGILIQLLEEIRNARKLTNNKVRLKPEIVETRTDTNEPAVIVKVEGKELFEILLRAVFPNSQQLLDNNLRQTFYKRLANHIWERVHHSKTLSDSEKRAHHSKALYESEKRALNETISLLRSKGQKPVSRELF